MLGYSITQWLFGILSFLAIMFGLMVVFSRNPVNSVLYLVLTFFSIAGLPTPRYYRRKTQESSEPKYFTR